MKLDDPAPNPCSDLSIGELIEWLSMPQYTNGVLNPEAATHMECAANLIEKCLNQQAKQEG